MARTLADYRERIRDLLEQSPFDIDLDIELSGRPPTLASSEFLTNKEQGDWAETVVFKAINEFCEGYFAVQYGRSESISAGDPGFAEFYKSYQRELNQIGKRPDLLVFSVEDFPNRQVNIEDEEQVSRAVAALEVRSSSFLVKRYNQYMSDRQRESLKVCMRIREEIVTTHLGALLRKKRPTLYDFLVNATEDSFKELSFRCPSYSSTEDLRRLTALLKELKENIKVLHKRDYLSITPKLEDIALVNRWIQRYGVKHFYLQVFFDKAYVISFEDILKITSDSDNEGRLFSVERDVKNQMKTTIKINIRVGREIIGRIDMPQHRSVMKELARGRLLFYVTFEGGKGYLDKEVFFRDVLNG